MKICKFLVYYFTFFCFILAAYADERDIQNLKDYFDYLPKVVHQNWIPYKANNDYKVVVQFRVSKNGEISDLKIVSSSEERANPSVLDAVKNAAPYKKLPASFFNDSIKTQVELNYMK